MDSNSQENKNSELRQSLENLLQTDFSILHENIGQLQARLQALESLSAPLPEDLAQAQKSLQDLIEKSREIENHILLLQNNLSDPRQVTDLIKRGLSPALQEEIGEKNSHYGEIIAPIISPAISNQIRNAQPEMVAALYPIIGQTIAKAISEAMQDLRRRIDANLKQNFNIKQFIQRIRARLRGISASDFILRESLGYKVLHVLLIHRETGLLIKQVSSVDEAQDSDIFSAMLTAIRDFAQDTFGSKTEDLEEIQYGDSHILLRNGLYTYLAVVVEGVQPVGYASLMQRVIHQINLDYDSELRHFSGEMDQLHDFHEDLSPLLNPSLKDLEPITPQQSLTHGQKIALGWGMAGFLLLLTLLVFGCIFSIRLMPVAFPAPTKTPTLEFTSTPTLTHTPPPTFTPSPTPTLHPTVTLSATSLPSHTPTLQNTSCTGIMNGNVWVRSNPIQSDTFNTAVLKDTPVEILAAYDIWVKISWEMETGDYEEGWVRSIWVDLSGPVPEQLITPVE